VAYQQRRCDVRLIMSEQYEAPSQVEQLAVLPEYTAVDSVLNVQEQPIPSMQQHLPDKQPNKWSPMLKEDYLNWIEGCRFAERSGIPPKEQIHDYLPRLEKKRWRRILCQWRRSLQVVACNRAERVLATIRMRFSRNGKRKGQSDGLEDQET